MIAAGLYDGSVVVYNLQSAGSEPVYQATANTGKHRDVVWSVRWTRDDLESYLNFFSVSEDSRVTHWTLVRSSLVSTDKMVIRYNKPLATNKTQQEKLGGESDLRIIFWSKIFPPQPAGGPSHSNLTTRIFTLSAPRRA